MFDVTFPGSELCPPSLPEPSSRRAREPGCSEGRTAAYKPFCPAFNSLVGAGCMF